MEPDDAVRAMDVEAQYGVLPCWWHEANDHDRQAWGTGKKKRKGSGNRRTPIKAAKRERIYKRDGYKCVECGNDTLSYLTIDHVVPRSKGGTNADSNLQTMCKTCNRRKGNKLTTPSQTR